MEITAVREIGKIMRGILLLSVLFAMAIAVDKVAVAASASAGTSAVSFAGKEVPAGEELPARVRSLGIELPAPASDRPRGEGVGPYPRLVIQDVMLVDGEGAPPRDR